MKKNRFRLLTVLLIGATLGITGNLIAKTPEVSKEVSNESLFLNKAVLGHAGTDFFTVSCRMNKKADVKLIVNDKDYKPHTQYDLIHCFRVDGLKPDTTYSYKLVATSDSDNKSETAGPFEVRTYPAENKKPEEYSITFAALGDSRSNPKVWKEVTDLAAAGKPAFMLHCGDFLSSGKSIKQWQSQVFGPAKETLSKIPFYPVYGNHEQNAPILLQMWQTPGGKRNWHQSIGTVDIIGIDTLKGFEKDSSETKWLEDVLSTSKAKFIFVMCHYPAWSSGSHGGVNKDGLPRDKRMIKSRTVIVPLLEKYNVTAFIVGHDHCYERSEIKNLTMLTLGGAGAPPYSKSKNAEKQNPYSKVFAKKHHYAIFNIEGDKCSMKVYDLGNKVLDECEWKSR